MRAEGSFHKPVRRQNDNRMILFGFFALLTFIPEGEVDGRSQTATVEVHDFAGSRASKISIQCRTGKVVPL